METLKIIVRKKPIVLQDQTNCRDCKTPVPSHFAFCEHCAKPAPHTLLSHRLLEGVWNFALLGVVFYLAGYTSSTLAVFAYLLYLYFKAVGFSLRGYRWERGVLIVLFLLAVMLATAYPYLSLGSVWFALGCGTAAIVVISSKIELERRVIAVSLLGVLCVQGLASLLRVRNEPDLGTAVGALFGLSEASFWPSMITLGLSWFGRIWLVTIFVVGLKRAYPQFAAINVGTIIARPASINWRVNPRNVRYTRTTRTQAHSTFSKLIAPISHMYRECVLASKRVWVAIINGGISLINSFISSFSRVRLGLAIFLNWLLREFTLFRRRSWTILYESLRVFAQSVPDAMRSVSVASLILILPLVMNVFFVKASFHFAEALVASVQKGPNISLIVHSLWFGVTFLVVTYLAGWIVRPEGTAKLWWRSAEVDLLLFRGSTYNHLRDISKSVTNYHRGFLQVLFLCYGGMLFFFDGFGSLLGHGPYKFGLTMLIWGGLGSRAG